MTTDKIVQLSPEKIKFSTVEQAIEDIKAGKFVVVADDEGRENEGDLVCAASAITPQMVNFMTKEARGLICVSLSASQAEKLGLPQMVDENTDPNQTAFTISVDAGPEFGVTTGISAADRSTTIQRMTASNATPQDFRRPGHVFPVQAKNGGVLRRVGHSEASSDLSRLAGFSGMGVMCEILNEDGNMARRDDLAAFAKKHGLSFITIAQLIQYRLQNERDVMRRVVKEIDTKFGRFTAVAYRDLVDGAEHLALVKGDLATLGQEAPYVRVQHENIITDVLGRASEDVPHDMAQALSFIEAQGKGAVIYLRHRDDSAHGLIGSLKAYNQETPCAAYQAGKADLRDYGVGAQILMDLGIQSFRMLGRSTKKIIALRGYGLEIIDNMPLATSDNFDFSGTYQDDTAVPAFIPAASQNETPAIVTASTQVETNTEEQTAQAQPQPVQEKETQQPQVAAASQPQEKPLVATAPASVPAPAPAPSPVVTPIVQEAQNENKKVNGSFVAETAFSDQHPVTMKMGGQIISNQALFEG